MQRGSTLITGASGFVGMALAKALRAHGQRVVSMVRDRTPQTADLHLGSGHTVVHGDVRDHAFCRRVLADYEVDTVYHLAAQSIVASCAEDPRTALDVAVTGTGSLFQAIRDTGRSIKVVISTSDKVHGSAPSPYDESSKLDARNAYEVSKACQDLVARMFFYNFGVDVRVVRAVNIYGPGDPNESRVMPQTILRILAGEPPLLHAGSAEMRRQYIYIDDMIEAFRTVSDKGAAGEIYCVGAIDAPRSVADVIREIARQMGVANIAPEVRERETRFKEIAEQSVRDDKLRGLGWKPTVAFEDGVRRTIAWYRERGGLHG